MEPFVGDRPEEINVYIEPRAQLHPDNQFLNQTGMIMMVEGEASPELALEIPQYFAREFGWSSQDYEVYQNSPDDDAPLLVICPGENCLRNLVYHSPHTIREGVQIGVVDWAPEWNLGFDPLPYQAWIRLVNMPFQAWNEDGIRQVTTGIGKVTGVIPYGRPARHFQHITVRIACKHPRSIPLNARYLEGRRSRRVRVVILQWRHWEQGPYPLHPDAWGVQVPAPSVQQQPPETSSDTTLESGYNDSAGPSHSVQGPGEGEVTKLTWKLRTKVKQVWRKKKMVVRTKATPKAQDKGSAVTLRWTADKIQILKDNQVIYWLKLNPRDFCQSTIIKCLVLLVGITEGHSTEEAPIGVQGQSDRVVPFGVRTSQNQIKGTGRNEDIIGSSRETERMDVQEREQEGPTKITGWEMVVFKSHKEKDGLGNGNTTGPQKGEVLSGLDMGLSEGEVSSGLDVGLSGEELITQIQMLCQQPTHQAEEDCFIPDLGQEDEGMEDGWLSPDTSVQYEEQDYRLQAFVVNEDMVVPVARSKKVVHTPRRSKRLSAKKKQYYGKEKKAKGKEDVMIIDFDKREEEIDAATAIQLVKESGALITDTIEKMFYEVQTGKKGETDVPMVSDV